MSRATKWKMEKAKVKVVFRLQFHATQIPQSGWEKLFISFIPTETGKATAKTSKANVRNGTCKWADPIYETTRLLVDSKTKQYDDKLYKLVVGMGTSRSSILGEATLNLSDYADASQPSAIALPLHGSDNGTVLHVTVQLLTAKTGFREFEQQRDKGLQRETELNSAKSPSSDSQTPEDLVNKAKTRIRLREDTNLHEEYSDSQVTCDESSNASESYFADKNNSPSNHEKSDVSDHADVAFVYEENHRLKGSLEIAESSISELKMELSVLQNHANEMGTETQKLAQELATEVASSQELVEEVTVLKSECLKFKHDLQQVKEMKSNSKLIETEKTEHNKEIKWVIGVAFVEDKIREIQEKILIGFRESDLSFLNSDLEMILGTLQDLKKETVDPENMFHYDEIPSLPLQEPDTEKAEREILVKKMDQMESYYEALVQELEENQKRILGEFETLKTEMNDLSSVNNELLKRAMISESALKRARLNYSIAVSQLQKDLDMLSFQVLSMFETNQTVIKESFPDNSQPVSKHISDDLKKSLSLQENIYKKVEEELSEMCCANLCLDVYSGTLKETLVEASDHLRKTNKKLQELAQKLQLSNQSRDVLSEDVRALNEENTYYLAKCNDLHVQNQLLEKDLGNVSNENFLLMEKITECEALLMDYRVYKSKHEVVSVEKLNLEKELEILKLENDDLKKKFKNSLHNMVAKFESPNVSLEKIQTKLDSFTKKIKSGFESEESRLENNEAVLTYLSSLELELQNISSEDKNFHEQIMGLDMMIEEFEKSKMMVSKLKQEKHDLILNAESKRDELSKVFSELGRLKESFRFVNDELDIERSTVACLTLELESQRSELDQVRKHVSDLELENNVIQENTICDDLKLTFVKTQYETLIDEFVKQLRVSSEQCKELEKKHLVNEARLNECLLSESRYIEENEKLLTELESVKLELDASIAQNAEFSVSKKEHDLEVGQLEDMLTKSKMEIERCNELQIKFQDTESRLKLCLENEARYIEENKKLSMELESVRFELEASIAKYAEISVSKNERDVEIGQLKDMLTKSKAEIEQYNELQPKFQDTESRLKLCLENEARYIEENKKLSMELESVRFELAASIAQYAEISVSKNGRDLEVGQLKDMLTKSKTEIERFNELQIKFQDTESRLKHCLENEARYIEENKKLSTEIESVRFELAASIAQYAEILVSKNGRDLEVGQLKDMLTKSKTEIERFNELQIKFQDTESRLKHCLENEARYIEENKKLSTEIESVRFELAASIAQYAEISVSKNGRDLEVGQLKDMLTKSKTEIERFNELQIKFQDTESRLKLCLENEARYIEENKKLSMELESVRFELAASIAQYAEISVSKNERDLEVGQLKDILTKSKAEVEQYNELQLKFQDTESRLKLCLENEARYIEGNKILTMELESLQMKVNDTEAKLKDSMLIEARYFEENKQFSTELESVKLELETSIAQNAVISVSKDECAFEVGQLKDMLTKSKAEIEQYNELQTKFQDTESRLKLYLENEARYVEDNKKLSTELEYVKLELEAFIAKNAEISVLKNKSDIEVGQLKDMLTHSKAEIDLYSGIQSKLQDTESRLKLCLENKDLYIEENRNLATEIESLKLQLEASIAQNAEFLVLKNKRDLEVGQLRDMLTKSNSEIEQYNEFQMKYQDTESRLKLGLENEARYIEEYRNLAMELESLRFKLKEESEIVLVVLKAKLDEQNDELITMQNKCSQLTNKLSEQILKTEEFKSLSIYLKELKENADMAREKKESEGPSESLRVAFIKEQYQAKFQELKQQLSVSKKHNEEMLFKLQDALDEIESRKKSEASQLKRIQELEWEVELVNSDKPDFDRIKAELECAILSLECCKEEKEKLVALLQECEDEKLKIAVEFSLIKEKLAQKEENGHMSDNRLIENKDEHAITSVDVQSIQRVTEREYQDEDNSLLNDSKQLMVVNDQFRTQHLRSCMEQLEEELEKMKNDNSLLPLTNYDPSFQDLQRELAQLNEANEELGSIYPNFVNFPQNGNALERVLALEIELAEALRSKKKPSLQFQSSFLKQHSDEEAVFKSFRDINELIKDMLEIKGKYVNVESELKEMHDRYSQLSLQFAEVEGERQKLMMTLKNVRSSRNLLRLNRSSMAAAALEDQTL